jgi:hypothetical protein
LLTAGRLLKLAPSWLQHCKHERTARSSSARDTILQLQKLPAAVAWLWQQLQDLQQHPTAAAAAARVPPQLLQELSQLADTLAAKCDVLNQLCDAAVSESDATGLPAGSLAAEVAVFESHLQACADGWLPEGLQQLGAKVWAAWLQKYACNDDLCLNLSGLTEQDCAKLKCSGCKVSGGCHHCGSAQHVHFQ